MATGDQSDMVARLRAVLPDSWFPAAPGVGQTTPTPVLDGVLAGLASCFSWLFSLLAYVNINGRLATAAGLFLDLIGLDFLGTALLRKPGQSDASWRARIQTEILAPKATRPAMVQRLTDLTGRAPVIFEPLNPTDTGGYSAGGVGYGVAGGYGSMLLPFQCFITAYRPVGGGIASVMGYTGIAPSSGLNAVMSSNGDATVAASAAVPQLIPGAIVSKCTFTASAGNRVAGFFSNVPQIDGTTYALAVWAWIPPGQPFSSVSVNAELGEGLLVSQMVADLSATGCWQRVGAVYLASGSMANLVLRAVTTAPGGVVYATCARLDASGIGLSSVGGYGVGAIEYASLNMIQGQVTDTDINEAIVACASAATIPWTRISN